MAALGNRYSACMCAKLLQFCSTLCSPWTIACQFPQSMGFSRQEYWSGLLCPSPGDLPNPGMEPILPNPGMETCLLHWQAGYLPPAGKTIMEKAMAPHSSTLAWKIPWMKEPGGLQSMGVTKSWTRLSDFTFTHWRRKWQPTPVFLPGESQGEGSLVGCPSRCCTESDTTKTT